MFDSERNKQHQRVLCKGNRKLRKEKIQQIAVRNEASIQKPFSPNTHDYRNTKMTEILMMI